MSDSNFFSIKSHGKFYQKRGLFLGLFFIIFLISLKSQARVFSFENESVAPYLNFRGGMSQLEEDPYAWQSASRYSGDKFDLTYGGEFGLYLRGAGMGLRLGVLVQTFDGVQAAQGLRTDGTALYSANSEGLLFGPAFSIDIQLAEQPTHLWKVVFGGGYQWGQFENNYSMTAAGEALVGGQSEFSETYKSQMFYAVAGVGTEIVLADETTIEFMLGYHHSFPVTWLYAGGGENFAGTHNGDDDVVFEGGARKTLNLSYPFLQVGFQFYLDLVR